VAEEAFAVIREAMEGQGVVGLGRAVIARRERLFVLEPRDKGILATALHYNYEVRDDHTYFEDIPDIKIPAEMLDLAKHIIQTKMSHFDITKFEDRYENALIEMIRAKQAGRPVEAQKPKQAADVVNLMDALRKSIAAETGAKEAQQAAVEGEKPKSARRAAKAPASEGARLRNAAEARVEPRRTGRAKSDDAEPSPPAAAKPARKTAGRR
jgi:DNA end-binding protein Ku